MNRQPAADGGRPRVLVDHSAAFDQGAGVGRYARHVVPAAANALLGARWILFHAPLQAGASPYGAETLAAFAPGTDVRVRRAPLGRRRLDQLWFRARAPLPVQWLAGGADAVYAPDLGAPPAGRTPRLPTLHDLAYLICPEHVHPRLRAYLAGVVPRQIAGASRVLAVSETTKRDLGARYDVAEDRIVVVPNGVEGRFFDAAPLSPDRRQTLRVPSSYLLCVGTVEPRKNLGTLFAALRHLHDAPPLVVAGARGWRADAILGGAVNLIEGGRVVVLGRVPDDLLPGLYAGAEAVVYPSWYEGFGLPVLEALAAGVPTVASTAPALVEVAGGTAMFAPADDPSALAAAIARALGSDQRAPAARSARQERAREYAWARSGAALAEVLREVTGG